MAIYNVFGFRIESGVLFQNAGWVLGSILVGYLVLKTNPIIFWVIPVFLGSLFVVYTYLRIKEEREFAPNVPVSMKSKVSKSPLKYKKSILPSQEDPLIKSKKKRSAFITDQSDSNSEYSFGHNAPAKKKDESRVRVSGVNEKPQINQKAKEKEELVHVPRKIKTYDMLESPAWTESHKRDVMQSKLMEKLNEFYRMEKEQEKRTQKIREAEFEKRKNLEKLANSASKSSDVLRGVPSGIRIGEGGSINIGGGALSGVDLGREGLRGECIKLVEELFGLKNERALSLISTIGSLAELNQADLMLTEKKYGSFLGSPMAVIWCILVNGHKYFKKKDDILELVKKELDNQRYFSVIVNLFYVIGRKIPTESNGWGTLEQPGPNMKTFKQWTVVLFATSLVLSKRNPKFLETFNGTVRAAAETESFHPLVPYVLMIGMEMCERINENLLEDVKDKCQELEEGLSKNPRLENLSKDLEDLKRILSTKNFVTYSEPEPIPQAPMSLGAKQEANTNSFAGLGLDLNQAKLIEKSTVSFEPKPVFGGMPPSTGFNISNTNSPIGIASPNPQLGLGSLGAPTHISPIKPLPPVENQAPPSLPQIAVPAPQNSKPSTPIETIKKRIESPFFIQHIYDEIWNFQDVDELAAHISEDSRYFKSINETVTRINSINFRKWKINYDGLNCSEEEKLQNLPPNILILRTFKNFLHNLHIRKPDYRFVQWMNDSRRVDTFCFNTFLLTPVIVAYPQYVEVLLLVFFKRYKSVLIDKKNIGEDPAALEEFRGKNGLLDSDDDFGYLFLYMLTMILYVLQWNIRHLQQCYPNEFDLPDYFKAQYSGSVPMIPCFFDSYLWLLSHLKTLPPSPVSFLVTRAVISTGEVLFFGRQQFDLSEPENVPPLHILVQESKGFRDMVRAFAKKHMRPGSQEWDKLVEKSILKEGEKTCLRDAYNTLKVDVSLRQLDKLESFEGTFIYEDWRHRDMFINIDLKENKNREFVP